VWERPSATSAESVDLTLDAVLELRILILAKSPGCGEELVRLRAGDELDDRAA
jgi:hypothetical protein